MSMKVFKVYLQATDTFSIEVDAATEGEAIATVADKLKCGDLAERHLTRELFGEFEIAPDLTEDVTDDV